MGEGATKARLLQSLPDRTAARPTKLLQFLSSSPATPSYSPSSSSSSSSSSRCSQSVEAMEKLRKKMDRIRAVLDGEEDRWIGESRIRPWLIELRAVAHAAEDVLDEVEYELLRNRLACEEGEHAPTALCPPLHDPLFQKQIFAQIGTIDDLFFEMCKDGLALNLYDVDGQRRICSLLALWNKVIDEQGDRGKKDEKCKVIDLLGPDADDMGGIGNTNLAQLVYNDNIDLLRITRARVLLSVG